MEMSLALMKNLVSMMLYVLVGFGIVKIGFLKSEDATPMTKLLAFLLTPCLIVSAFQRDISASQITGFFVAVAVAFGIMFFNIFVVRLAKKPLRLSVVDRASMIYMNAGNLILPLVLLMFGEDMVFYCCAILIPFNLLAWSHGVAMFAEGKPVNAWKMVLNPNVLAILISVSLMFLKIRLPQVLMTTVSGFGSMVGPMSMLLIGMVIAEQDLKLIFTMKRAWVINFGRLIVLPALAMLVLYATGFLRVHPEYTPVLMVTFLSAIAPPAATTSQQAVVYDNEPVKASSYNVLGTLLCVVTMPIMILLYQKLFGM